jgi:outer membrane protein OmpA-like peptidoglycan-associated protein
MKKIFYSLLIIILVFTTSCGLFFGSKYTEPASTVDCPPGQGNTLNYTLKGKKELSEVTTQPIYLQLSRINTENVSSQKEDINIYLHPIDENGNFITGIGKSEYWCEVIDSSFGKEKIISSFDLEEISVDEPLAIAIVMDHSGSMGEARVKTVQQEVFNFLKNKSQPDDDIYLIKYDNEVELEAYPGYNYLNGFKDGFINGFSYFGGGTAFYDAVGKGIEAVSNSHLKNKIVIALTDGLENSSVKYTSPMKLVEIAKKNNVSVTTIGFGDNIDKPMLADTVALGSGGVYHQICRSDDFALVFDDIYKRYKNYYLLKYRTNRSIGNHKILVKLCLPDREVKTENNYFVSVDNDSIFIIDNIFFEYNSDKLKSKESKEAIDIMDMMMNTYADMEIEIYGHTDSIGSAQYNYDLSERRAKSVYNALKNRGHSITRMGYKGFGESMPISDNGNDEGRQQNRRVEFKIRKFEQNNFTKREIPIYKTPSETIIK